MAIINNFIHTNSKDNKVIFGEYLNWNDNCTVGGHIYAKWFLSRGYQLCWVSHPLSIFHILKYREEPHSLIKAMSRQIILAKETGSILAIKPFTLIPYLRFAPFNSSKLCAKSLNFTMPNLKSILCMNRFESVKVLWLTNPYLYGLLNLVKPEIIVFRITDNIFAAPGAPSSLPMVMESLIRKADVIFCTSKRLSEMLESRYKKAITFLPNAFDAKLFKSKNEYKVPAEYEHIDCPIAIYIGAIDKWFDIELMYYLCMHLQHVHFVLIGPIGADMTKLRSLRNISILGPRNRAEIPAYLYNADIGIIPFKKNKFTDYIHPIKLYEYCAAGLSVVATDLTEIRDIGSPALLATSYEQFAKYIADLIKNPIDKNKAINFAMKNTWDERFDKVESYLSLRLRNQ